MTWFNELIEAYRTNAARMFILHFNVDDYIFDPDFDPDLPPAHRYDNVTRIIPCLQRFGRGLPQPFTSCYRYSTSMQTTYPDSADTELADADDPAKTFPGKLVTGSTRWQATLAGVPPLHEEERVLRAFELILRSDAERSMVFIEHLEYLAPRADAARGGQEINIEILRRLANDFVFRRSNNMLVLITRELNAIDPGIYAPGSNCVPIQVPLPSRDEREQLLRLMDRRAAAASGSAGAVTPITKRMISGLAPPSDTLNTMASTVNSSQPDTLKLLAGLTEGFRLIEIDQLNRQVLARGLTEHQPPILELDDIKQLKRRAIDEQSGGILEIVDVERGFDAIGGMDVAKGYLRTVQTAISHAATNPDALSLVPRGIVLAGPPGTGKTIIAEALARESGLNMVKLRNIRQQWVGSSERNLSRAFELIRALSPILVFVDEIDQAFGSRGVGSTNDGGTSERLFGMTLEFIGDERNRGRVIWVAATNRPDSLDAALLRRFDRIIPCLLPTPDEQLLILKALPRTIRQLEYHPDLAELIKAGDTAVRELFLDRDGMTPTGAVIEAIARRAVEIAQLRALPPTGVPPHPIGAPTIPLPRMPDTTPPPTVPLGTEAHSIDAPTAPLGTARAVVEFADLRQAVADYRSNANQDEYDFQSLLAIRACNFYSVMPSLPARAPFSAIVAARTTPAGPAVPGVWQRQEIVYSQLDAEITRLRSRLR